MINPTPSRQHHRHNTINTTLSAQRHQHNNHEHNTTNVSLCVAGAAHKALPERSADVRQRLSSVDTGCVCLAGATLGAPQCHFAWQVQHTEHLQRGPQKSGDDWVPWTPAAFAQHLEHLENRVNSFRVCKLSGRCILLISETDTRFWNSPRNAPHWLQSRPAPKKRNSRWPIFGALDRIHHKSDWDVACMTWERYARYQRTLLRPKRTHSCEEKKHHAEEPSPWDQHLYALVLAQPSYPSASFCTSTHHRLHNTIYTTSSSQHHLPTSSNTTSSTQPHQHSTIYITPSKQHQLHNIILTRPSHYIITYWQVQHLEHCHPTPSASILLTPLLLWFVLCSVSLTYSTLGCPKTLLTCGVIRSFNLLGIKPYLTTGFKMFWDIYHHW